MLTPELFSLLCTCSGDLFAESVGDIVMCPSIPKLEKWSKTLNETAIKGRCARRTNGILTVIGVASVDGSRLGTRRRFRVQNKER